MQGVPSTFNAYTYGFCVNSHSYISFNYPNQYYHSSDFGITWNKISFSADDHREQYLYPIKDSIFLTNNYRSTDYGITWEKEDLAFKGVITFAKTIIKQIKK